MVVSGENMKKMVKSNQLELDDGDIDLLGFRMGMVPIYTWTKLIERLYEMQGEEAFDILFEVGKEHGQYAIDEIGKEHDIPRRQFLDQSLYTADVLGLGRFSLEKINFESGKIIYKIEDSPFKEEFENSDILSDLDREVDDLQRGMFHKVAECVLDSQVESRETHCTFKGDSYCRFVVERKEG